MIKKNIFFFKKTTHLIINLKNECTGTLKYIGYTKELVYSDSLYKNKFCLNICIPYIVKIRLKLFSSFSFAVYSGLLCLLLPRSRSFCKSYTFTMAQVHWNGNILPCSWHSRDGFGWIFSISRSLQKPRVANSQFHWSLALFVCCLC